MRSLSNIGRIFYGIAMAGLGLQTIYHRDFPYMLLPPNHDQIPGLMIVASVSGIFLVVTGASIVFEKAIKTASLSLGLVLLLVFCFYFIPYELFVDPDHLHFGAWENSEKELALSAGAFIMAGAFSESRKNQPAGFLEMLIRWGPIFFLLTIICFGIGHFLYAKELMSYMPSWVQHPIFWSYVAGTILIGSAMAIIFKVRTRLFCTLLGGMIFTWFIILHIPKVIAASAAERTDEISSALLALAYCGIAFVIPRKNAKEAR